MRKGQKASEETRRKISESKTGNKHPNFGKKLSEETRGKIRMGLIGNTNALGLKRTERNINNWRVSRKGYFHSVATRHKISVAMIGKKVSEETKRKLSAVGMGNKNRLGDKLSEETKRKMSEAHKGEKSFLWKGGITKESRSARNTLDIRLWREAVFVRDNWTCQKYGIRGGKLHSHHILNFSERKDLRHEISNGITMSKKAHLEFHNKYGRINNTKKQIEEFIGRRLDTDPTIK